MSFYTPQPYDKWGDLNVQTFYAINSLRGEEKYSELDFEYLPWDNWAGETDHTSKLYMTSWADCPPPPEPAENGNRVFTPFAGSRLHTWNELLFEATDDVCVRYYVNQEPSFEPHKESELPSVGEPVYPDERMMISLANWIGTVGPSDVRRNYVMKCDWVYHVKDLGLSISDVQRIVEFYRTNLNLPRKNTISETPLPVTLAAFAAIRLAGSRVRIDWSTSSEVNNYGFEIERRVGQETFFKKLTGGFVSGHGTTIQPHQYSFVDSMANGETLTYRLKQINLDGTFEYSDPIQVEMLTAVQVESTPTTFELFQNHPNPFNPTTTIRYSLPHRSRVRLVVFNAIGEQAAILQNEDQEAGYHEVRFYGTNLPSGVYYCQMEAGAFRKVNKLVLIR